MDLLVAVLRRGLGLVQALQAAIVALVEPPARGLRQPHPVQAVEHDPQGSDRALEDGGERLVELDPLGPQELAGFLRLRQPGRRQVDVDPAGEAVLEVPVALAVSDHRQMRHVALLYPLMSA